METKEKNYTKQIDKTVETITAHVEKKSGTGLTTTISKWIDVLDEHKELRTIAADLKKLQQAIEDKDTQKAITLMATLGEETIKVADDAEGSEKMKIKALGKSLTTASKTIAKFL